MRSSAWLLLAVLGLVLMPWLPAVSAQPQVEVLEAPDVVVANDPETMSDDPETEEREFNPEYLFSTQIRVTNDGTQRNAWPHTILYVEQDVEDGCPQDERRKVIRTDFVQLRFNLSADEQVVAGGETDRREAEAKEYWPMAIPKKYYSPRERGNVSVDEGPHTFCVVLRTSGEDPSCDRPSNRTCVVAKTPFESYVRRDNEAPVIEEVSVRPENPRPGQTTLFEARASDASTQPREDTLSYTWTLAGDTQRGPTIQHAFETEQVHEVELAVSDGFDTVNRTVEVPVGEATVDEEDPQTSPVPGAIASLLVLGASALLRRRER